jgi:hypothetical protein
LIGTELDPTPDDDQGMHRIELKIYSRHDQGGGLVIDELRVCGNCGVLVFNRMTERHRRSCEPRAYDLDPLSPVELGP